MSIWSNPKPRRAISPYLLRPRRSLEEACAETEGERNEDNHNVGERERVDNRILSTQS